MIKKLLLLSLLFFFTFQAFSQRNSCDDNAAGEITVGASCVLQAWDSSNNTDYWNGAAGCGATDVDDVWGWFDATSALTTISYTPDTEDAILTLLTGPCVTLMGSLDCSNVGGNGVTETITYATTIGVRYRVRVQRNGSNANMTGDICVYNSTPPCNPPTLNAASGVTATAATISWNAPTPVPTGYEYVVSTVNTTPGGAGTATTNLAENLTGLSPSTTYYVFVRSECSGNFSSWTASISFTTLAGLPNDECAGAIGLTVNPDENCGTVTAGTINGATDSGLGNSTCFGTEDDDVWYSFVATNTAHTIDLLNITGGTTDLYHVVYAGNCGALGAALLCSDPNSSTVSGLTIGNTYYVQVYSWTATSGQTSDFDICIGTPPPPPANDECAGAIGLTVNPDQSCAATTSGTIESATDSGLGNSTCFGTEDDDVWYSFVATGPVHTVDLINVAGSTTDLYHVVYDGSSGCGALGAAILCSDPNSSTVNGLTPGNTYYVQVYTWTGSSGQNSTFDICIGTPPPPPANDECAGAISLTVNPDQNCAATTSGTVFSATDSGVAGSGCFGTDDDDVWYSFVATGPAHTVDILNIAGSTTDMYHAVYDGLSGCGSLGAALECSDPNSSLISGLTPGNTYYVQVYTWTAISGQTSTFDICIGTPPPPPSNDTCAGAIPLTLDATCNFVTFSNESALDSGELPLPGCANYQGGDVWFTVEVPPSGVVTVDMDTGVMTDSGLAFYSGTCGALSLIECDDDDSSNGLMSRITRTGLTPCDIIYIRVWEYGNNNNGQFQICATTTVTGTNGVTVCEGDTCGYLTTDITCSAVGTTSLGNTINGNLNAASDPVALQPLIFIESADPCGFDATDTANYTTVNFTVTATGTYTFAMETPVPYFDGMGYIVETGPPAFTPGSCATGVWIAGDDDTGPALDPEITATLTAGVSYTLVTTVFSFGSTTHTGPFTWNVITPSLPVEWYTTATGGSPIGSGAVFDPVGVPGSGLTDTNTAGTYSFWAGCPGGPRTQADYVITPCCTRWTAGNNSTDWYDAGNWSTGVVPTITDCVEIQTTAFDPILTYPGAPVPPTPGEALSLVVESGASLEIATDKVLTVSDWINVEPGASFTVRSGASLVQIDDTAVNTGDINMERTVASVGTQDYVYWGSPVENFPVTGISPGTTAPYIWEWIPTIANNFGQWQNTTENMIAGKGYIVRDVIGTATASTPLFVGVPQNGILTRNITRGTYNGGQYPGPGDTPVENEDDNWNLISNPFPSAIDYTTFMAHANNNDIDGTIYLWTHQTAPSNTENSPFYQDFVYSYSANDYIEYNSTGANPPGSFFGNIGAAQGFFVLMLHTSPTTSETITFNNSMRSATIDNSLFYEANPEWNSTNADDSEDEDEGRIWIDLINSNNEASSLLLGYVDGATDGNDRLYDGYEFSGTGVRFYTKTGEEKLSIQGKALPFDELDTVPMGFTVLATDTYQIAINTVDGLFENEDQNIFLEDTYEDVIHDLRLSPYSFSSEAGNFDDRFILRYTDNTLGTDDLLLNSDLDIISEDNVIKVISGSHPIDAITVYDLLGRRILELSNLNTLEYNVDGLSLSKSVYIVRARLQNGYRKTKKVVH